MAIQEDKLSACNSVRCSIIGIKVNEWWGLSMTSQNQLQKCGHSPYKIEVHESTHKPVGNSICNV